jgi:hypothetical protein
MESIPEETVTAPTDNTVPATQGATTPKRQRRWMILGFVVATVVILLQGLLLFDMMRPPVTKEPTLTPQEEAMVWRPHKDFAGSTTTQRADRTTATSSGDVIQSPAPATKRELYALREATNIAPYDAVVAWLPIAREVSRDSLPVLVSEYTPKVLYTGKVTDSGALAGADLYIIYEEGMGNAYPSLYAISSSSAVAIDKEWPMYFGRAPYWITDATSGLKLSRDEYMVGATLQDLIDRSVEYGSGTVAPVAFVDDLSGVGGQLYQYEQCFFGKTPSGLLTEYVVDIPFVDNRGEGGYGTPAISFNRADGTFVSAEYEIYDRVSYGCGSLCSPLKVVNRPDSDFVKTGTTADGSSLFVLKDPYDPLMEELYNQPNTRAFVDTSGGSYDALEKNKYSYEQYVSMAPLLFWKDQLGRWVKFVHSEFLILAEKCKPVIYLYPEQEMDVAVEVAPNLGFTKTIPEYGNGWQVTARPDGTIIDKTTGIEYPYLYWTGWVEGYPLVERGWVVPQADLDAFFDRYLPKLGMVGQEITDFKEYWEEDMNDAPYYAITFIDQKVINDLSPLAVSGDPDVIIRVMMTAQPLLRPIALTPPVLPPTPTRHGFTVVEWGGTILRNNEVTETR